jgi:hypothetical protein
VKCHDYSLIFPSNAYYMQRIHAKTDDKYAWPSRPSDEASYAETVESQEREKH